ELLHRQLRAFEDREFGLVGAPLALAELHPVVVRPRLDDRTQLRLGEVEATKVVWKLAQLQVIHAPQARTSVTSPRTRAQISARSPFATRRPSRCAARSWGDRHRGCMTTSEGRERSGWLWR